MGRREGKKLLITGVLTDASLAFEVAKLAQEQGAEIVLTGAGRAMRLTERTARKLARRPPPRRARAAPSPAPLRRGAPHCRGSFARLY